jgi:hypothetical protein
MMPGLCLELAANLFHDRTRCTTDRGHGNAAEQIGDEAAEDQAGNHIRVGQIERDLAHILEIRIKGRAFRIRLTGKELKVVRIGREQHQCTKTGRTDGIALGHGLGGVADGVERVCRLADFRRKTRHFGDAAGVVGDRAEGIQCHDHAGNAEHCSHRDTGAEQASPSW